MSNFRSNNSKLPQMSQFTQQIRPNRRSMSIYGQIDGPFHSDLSQSWCGSSRLFELRKQRRGGGGHDFQSRRQYIMDTDSHKIQQLGLVPLMFGFGQ